MKIFFLTLLLSSVQTFATLPPIWRNDEVANGTGHVYWQTHEFCKEIEIEDAQFTLENFNTMKDLRAYTLKMNTNKYTKAAKALGLDVAGSTMAPILGEGSKYKGLECCVGKGCENFVLFSIGDGKQQVGINPKDAEILSSAQPIITLRQVPVPREKPVLINSKGPIELKLMKKDDKIAGNLSGRRMYILVNISRQKLTVYLDGKPVPGMMDIRVSTGLNSTPTRAKGKRSPNEEINISRKSKEASKKYGRPIYLEHAIHYYEGVFLHSASPGAMNYLGQKRSAGCVRVDRRVMPKIFELAKNLGGKKALVIEAVN